MGAENALCAALAVISGHTKPLPSRSLLTSSLVNFIFFKIYIHSFHWLIFRDTLRLSVILATRPSKFSVVCGWRFEGIFYEFLSVSSFTLCHFVRNLFENPDERVKGFYIFCLSLNTILFQGMRLTADMTAAVFDVSEEDSLIVGEGYPLVIIASIPFWLISKFVFSRR